MRMRALCRHVPLLDARVQVAYGQLRWKVLARLRSRSCPQLLRLNPLCASRGNDHPCCTYRNECPNCADTKNRPPISVHNYLPAMQPTVIPNGAGRRFSPRSLPRMRRPADVRNLSLYPFVRPQLTPPRIPWEAGVHELIKGEIPYVRRPTHSREIGRAHV